MLLKKGIRYLRYSHDKQSYHSIERQDHVTSQWMNFNKVEIVDTFKDEGYTARTFDRPDIKLLFEFIRKNHRGIDFLVVSELTRFSREAGDAINMVKKIQKDYGVRIVSAGRGTIYDCLDHNSFFMMGLEFLLGNSENIKRTSDINGGIYTAKAIKGLWIQGGPAPYGYKKSGTGEKRRLIIDDKEAAIVKYIYDAYLANVPLYVIKKNARELGFTRSGNSAVEGILTNPIYFGYQYVKPWKEQAGGLFALADHNPIVDVITWNRVQEKMKQPTTEKVIISDDFPLRGVLRCHCGKPLTGAPSRGRAGKYYNYYKCPIAGHNNINSNRAHSQLEEILTWMSLPHQLITEIKDESTKLLEIKLAEGKKILNQHKLELEELECGLHSVESKWIKNQMAHDTYHRWHGEFTEKIRLKKAEIDKLDKDQNEVYFLLQTELDKLSDLKHVYISSTLPQKQELLRTVFDSTLYYQNQLYRTTYIMEIFTHNLLTLKEKRLLEMDENKKTGLRVRSGGGDRIRTGVQTYSPKAFYMLIPALIVGK
jgi:site-specific DNA recombinase